MYLRNKIRYVEIENVLTNVVVVWTSLIFHFLQTYIMEIFPDVLFCKYIIQRNISQTKDTKKLPERDAQWLHVFIF